MKVAVLMSTYNGEKYLKDQIDSILGQAGDFQLDLWVRDDGSKDRTTEILDEYASCGKLKWYAGKNLKPAYSFLDLLKNCVGYDYYAFADQDDLWVQGKLNAGIQAIKEYNVPALYCANAELVDHNLKTLGRYVYKKEPKLDFTTLLCSGGLLGCTMVFNSALAELVQKYHLPGNIVMHDFYISLLCLAKEGEIVYDNVSYMKYRQHINNVVGVDYGIIRTIKSRLNRITTKPEVSISDQAKSILELYGSDIEQVKFNSLKRIANYKEKLFNRITLACSRKISFINFNMSISLRLSILLGNR